MFLTDAVTSYAMSYRPDVSLPSTNSFSFVSRTLAGTFSLLGLTATFDTSKLHESKSDVSSLQR